MASSGRLRVAAGVLLAALFLVSLVAGAAAWWVRQRITTAPRPEPAPPNLARGRLLYVTTCQNCHGPEGRGDGPSAFEMKPPPRDFAERPWKHGSTPEAVRKVIRDGVLGTSMPGNRGLSDSDLDNLTAYVMTLAPGADTLSHELRERLKAVGFTPVDPPRSAPDLDVVGIDGVPKSLKQLRGRTVLVNFWGTECVHCLAEMPDLERLAEQLSARDGEAGLIVLPVCFDETDREVVAKTARQHSEKLPVFVDPRGLGRQRFGAQVLPSTYLIDPNGRLIGSAEGRHAWSAPQLRALLAALVEP